MLTGTVHWTAHREIDARAAGYRIYCTRGIRAGAMDAVRWSSARTELSSGGRLVMRRRRR